MNSLKSLFLLSVLPFLLFSGMKCDKEDLTDPDGLPKATQTGAMVFACKINGVNWISSSERNNAGGGIAMDTIEIHGTNPDDSDFYESLIIQINHLADQTALKLNDPTDRFAIYSTNKPCFNTTSGYNVGRAKSTDGQVIFSRIDKINKIIAGTFWFDIPTDNCGVLHVTDGRFDIKYY